MINNSSNKKSLLMLCFIMFNLANTASLAGFEFGTDTWSNDKGEQILPGKLGSNLRVVSLFYTDCPNTCSLTIEKFKQLETLFEKNDLTAEFVLLSLDPKNDTPPVLKEYRTERNLLQSNWHFLTSTKQQVGAIARKLGYQFTRLDDHVFHRMKVFIFDSNSNIIDVVKMGTDVEKLSILTKKK